VGRRQGRSREWLAAAAARGEALTPSRRAARQGGATPLRQHFAHHGRMQWMCGYARNGMSMGDGRVPCTPRGEGRKRHTDMLAIGARGPGSPRVVCVFSDTPDPRFSHHNPPQKYSGCLARVPLHPCVVELAGKLPVPPSPLGSPTKRQGGRAPTFFWRPFLPFTTPAHIPHPIFHPQATSPPSPPCPPARTRPP
jgi:hypothetical protein